MDDGRPIPDQDRHTSRRTLADSMGVSRATSAANPRLLSSPSKTSWRGRFQGGRHMKARGRGGSKSMKSESQAPLQRRVGAGIMKLPKVLHCGEPCYGGSVFRCQATGSLFMKLPLSMQPNRYELHRSRLEWTAEAVARGKTEEPGGVSKHCDFDSPSLSCDGGIWCSTSKRRRE